MFHLYGFSDAYLHHTFDEMLYPLDDTGNPDRPVYSIHRNN